MVVVSKAINYFKDWNWFERVWLVLSSIVMISLSVAWGDNVIALISGITGIIGVVLCAKGRVSTYIFATVNVACYAYISYGSRLYGEAMLNAFYFIPMNIVGFILWRRHKSNDGEVEARNLSLVGIIIITLATAAAVIAYWQLLKWLKGNLTLIDSITTVLSVIAIILQVTRYSEQWILWIIINIVSIVMWSLRLLEGDSSGITMIVMWSAYLLNSVYGYINWKKLAKGNF